MPMSQCFSVKSTRSRTTPSTPRFNTAGFSELKVWSGQPGQCGNSQFAGRDVNTCYPPAVNYTPLYYLFNGVAFDKTHPSDLVVSNALGYTGVDDRTRNGFGALRDAGLAHARACHRRIANDRTIGNGDALGLAASR